MARIAPNCINTSKRVTKSDEKPFMPVNPMNFPTIIICPVEDIGRNSVMPSTTPIIKDLNNLNKSNII
jgi:hypothetical protein